MTTVTYRLTSFSGSNLSRGNFQGTSSSFAPRLSYNYPPLNPQRFLSPRYPPPSIRPNILYGDRSFLINRQHNMRHHEFVELKRRTYCNNCGLIGHWWQECPHIASSHRPNCLPAQESFTESFNPNTFYSSNGENYPGNHFS